MSYRYAVTGFEPGMEDCPQFTNQTKTIFGAKRVEHRFRKQGLLTKIYDLSKESAPGENPSFEIFETAHARKVSDAGS